MPQTETFTLGPFSVDSDGQLSPRTPESVAGLSVAWRGRPVRLRLASQPDAPGGGKLSVQALLGRVPSTGSGTGNDTGRERSFAVLRELRRHVPAGWRFALLPDHRAMAETERAVSVPMSACDLIAGITCALIDLDPYLVLLDADETGLELPSAMGARSAAPGTAKI
jgi:hypothetical protein